MKRGGMGEARRLFRARRFPDVIRLLEPEVFRYRENFDYFRTLGLACLHTGDFGGAFSYMSRALQLHDDDISMVLGIAAVHFRRAEHEAALKRWLQVVEIQPSNPIAKRGLELLRRGMTADALQEFIDSGRLKVLFPPLPSRVRLLPVALVLLSCLAVAGLAYLGVRVATPRGTERPGVSVIELPAGVPDVDTGTNYLFVMKEGEVRQTFQRAKSELLSFRDNLAVVDINRLLLSNAAPAVKERARMLKGFVTPPSFDTARDLYTYASVSHQPVLYDGAAVVWKGKVANLATSKTQITFDLLVGYDQEKELQGIVPVTLSFAADLGNGDAVQVLGQLTATGSTMALTGISLHRISQ